MSGSPLTQIDEMCEVLQRRANSLASINFADDRGWLGADDRAGIAESERELQALREQAERLWYELPSVDPSAVECHDDRTRAALQRLEQAGGERNGFFLADLRTRALATCSPERSFDFWAIWAIRQLC